MTAGNEGMSGMGWKADADFWNFWNVLTTSKFFVHVSETLVVLNLDPIPNQGAEIDVDQCALPGWVV